MRLIQEGPTRPGGVMVVAEAPGYDEDQRGRPFVGASGYELDQELGLAGWSRGELFLTNVCHERPPNNDINEFFWQKSRAPRGAVPLYSRYPKQPVLDGLTQLQRDVGQLKPQLILALGNTALWALTGKTGITSWRGSILPASGGPVDGGGAKLIPTLHPAAVLRDYPWRSVVIQDLRRAKRESQYPEIQQPDWNFIVPTTVNELIDWLDTHITPLPLWYPLAGDVENFYERDQVHDGRLICFGLAPNKTTACCIPFVTRARSNPNWWPTAAAERDVLMLLKKVITRRPMIFHNGVHDCQIMAGNYGILPNIQHDTMIAQHIAFPAQLGGKIDPVTGATSKSGSSYSLAFCSSMYCKYHAFWKDDGRGWDATISDEMTYWRYNCEDVVRTYEVWEELCTILKNSDLWEQYLFYVSLFDETFEMMFAGLNYDDPQRQLFRADVERQIEAIQVWIDGAVGHELNTGSNGPGGQMQRLFYNDFGIPPFLHRKTRKPTLDDAALAKIAVKYRWTRPLIERIQGIRSLKVFGSNFLDVQLSGDGRLRSSINIAGPETMRFSMNTTAFNEGGNLQNLPRD